MIFIPVLCAFIAISVSQPTETPNTLNVITVPTNCPEGQELVNGVCRDIWSWRNDPNAANLGVVAPSSWNRNVVTVPTNCPPGQQLINGVCRDVWRFFRPTTPLPKTFDEAILEDRDRRQTDTEVNVVDGFEILEEIGNRNIINVPSQCPIGYKPDAYGVCRQILASFISAY